MNHHLVSHFQILDVTPNLPDDPAREKPTMITHDNPLDLFNLSTNLFNLAYRSFYALHCELDFPMTAAAL